MRAVTMRKRGDYLDIDFTGEGFLRHMVRALVGTLVETGRGRFGPAEIKAILASRNRSRAGPTAPARGLYLMEVHYPPDITWSVAAP
jgi:tRNA pseudouridine38-40 synthase